MIEDLEQYIVFEYLYRDASNNKSWGSILLLGAATLKDEEDLRNAFESGEYFVAEQIGIPTLYAGLYRFSAGPTDEDHAYHEFSALRAADETEVGSLAPLGIFSEFKARVLAARNCWDLGMSVHGLI